MASTRVERVLDEIAQLSRAERQELSRVLPSVLEGDTGGGGLNSAALERARENRERIRARLLAEGQPLFSISEELEAMREERDQEILAGLPRERARKSTS